MNSEQEQPKQRNGRIHGVIVRRPSLPSANKLVLDIQRQTPISNNVSARQSSLAFAQETAANKAGSRYFRQARKTSQMHTIVPFECYSLNQTQQSFMKNPVLPLQPRSPTCRQNEIAFGLKTFHCSSGQQQDNREGLSNYEQAKTFDLQSSQ